MENPQHLTKGSKLALRLWDETDVHGKCAGYVLEGTATLHLNGQKQELKQGDAYLVPAGVKHSYDINGRFRCIEATSV